MQKCSGRVTTDTAGVGHDDERRCCPAHKACQSLLLACLPAPQPVQNAPVPSSSTSFPLLIYLTFHLSLFLLFHHFDFPSSHHSTPPQHNSSSDLLVIMIVNPEMLKSTASLLLPTASSSVAPIPTVDPGSTPEYQKAGDVGNRTLWYVAFNTLPSSAIDKLT